MICDLCAHEIENKEEKYNLDKWVKNGKRAYEDEK